MKTPRRTDFARYVAKAQPANRRLQLFHTCDGFTIRSVIEDRRLRSFPRESFDGDKILFLYYGRPAYRLSISDTPTSHRFFLPICFILSPDAVPTPKRIFPFDTGAVESGLFTGSLHPEMRRDDFQMFAQIDTPQKLVTSSFGTNERYFRGKPKPEVVYDALDFETEAYLAIVNGESSLNPDDRRSVIEIHSEEDILLENVTLEAVILPGIFLDNVRVRDFFLRQCGAQPLPYDVYHFRVTEYMSDIYRLAREFMGLGSD